MQNIYNWIIDQCLRLLNALIASKPNVTVCVILLLIAHVRC